MFSTRKFQKLWELQLSDLLVLLCVIAGSSTVQGAQPLTTCQEVLALSPAEAGANRSVKLRGTLTLYVQGSGLCFIQDATAGVYVLPNVWPKNLTQGKIIELEGTSAKGRFSPIVQASVMHLTDQEGDVRVKAISIEELNSGQFDAQSVAIEGVVQSASFSEGFCTLSVWAGGSAARIMNFGMNLAPQELVDARIRIEGVGGSFYEGEQLRGFGLFLNSPSMGTVLSAAKPPFETPLRLAGAPAAYTFGRGLEHRIRLQGVVTVTAPGEGLYLQDSSGAMQIVPASLSEHKAAAGDLVEVAGFARNVTGVPVLHESLIRKKGVGALPEAPFFALRDILAKPAKGTLLSAEGLVQGLRGGDKDWTVFELRNGPVVLTAIGKRDSLGEIRTGSRLRVSGAWCPAPAPLRQQLGSVLWINSKGSINMVAAPRAVAPNAGDWHTTLLIISTIAALVFAAGVVLYAHRNGKRLKFLVESNSLKLNETERELHRLNQARETLGRDLHDRIIQSIYGIGLNIDDCAVSVQADPNKVENRLRAALRDVNTVIAELRNVILGLETNAIQPREFRTALKSLALALGREDASRIRLRIDEEALASLSPTQATELVHVAREALSNSIRHGGAQTTSFCLELREDKVTFSIEDDGRGFNPKTAERKGFGLRNMAKRSEQLGAYFSISSEEGQGTRVVLDIPRQKQHLSSK